MRMLQAVIVFGVGTLVFALSRNMALTLAALAVMGAADTVSVVIRHSLVQLRTPDEMRGRVGAVNYLFINASNQLGEFESGMTAALFGAVPAAVIGGVGTVAVALLWMRLFPELRQRRAAGVGRILQRLRRPRTVIELPDENPRMLAGAGRRTPEAQDARDRGADADRSTPIS